MNGHQDLPDIRQRRRVTRLRANLGLAPVPPHVGTELRTIAPRISEQLAQVLRHDPAYAALTPDGQLLLLRVIARAVDEFARLVEDRPPQVPPVEAGLLEIVHVEGELEPCRAALHAAFQTLRDVARVLWPQLPHARPYSNHLDAALARYATGLCERTMDAPRAPTPLPTPRRNRSGAAHVDGLLAMVEQRWGAQPVELYLSVSTLGTTNIPTPRSAAQRTTPRALSFVGGDHAVIIAEHPIPSPQSAPTTRLSVVVCVGPVPASGIAQVYDTALLLLRLIRAGVAAPPSPVLLHLPNLGFLHPSPSEATVRKITDLLHPLTGQGSHRRSTLARTLQLCLRTATTAQGLARQLAMHPQTVHNHIAALRTLYNADLDFADDNLAMQAALDLVLPLWELEATSRVSGPSPHA